CSLCLFFSCDSLTSQIYTLSLHDALPISVPEYGNALREDVRGMVIGVPRDFIALCREKTSPEILQMVDEAIGELESFGARIQNRSEEHTSELQSRVDLVCRLLLEKKKI